MKNIITTIVAALFVTATYFAQEKAPTPKAEYKPKQAAAPAPVLRDEALCKAWKLISYERFSVVNTPEENQKQDGVTYMADGTVFLTMDGVTKTGTWSNDKTRVWVNMVFDNGEKYKFKIVTLTADQFEYIYQDKELMSTKYTCGVQKK